MAEDYYPMTSAAYIEGSGVRMTVFGDRSVGVTSQEDGVIELMIERVLS